MLWATYLRLKSRYFFSYKEDMPKSGRQGPQIESKAGKKKSNQITKSASLIRYDPAYSLQWPVFPVKLSSDPSEIRAARNLSVPLAKDPEGVGELKLVPEKFHFKPNETEAGEIALRDGPYVIPTSAQPLRVYAPLTQQPRALDRVVALDLHFRTPFAEAILGFAAEYGLPYCTWNRSERRDGWFRDCVSDVRSDFGDLQEHAQRWMRVRAIPFANLSYDDR